MTTRPEKSPSAFRTISEVADSMGVPQHVLRFWESKFNQISPMKRGGGRRYYRPEDIQIIEVIRNLLHEDGYTIKGAQKHLREQGVKAVIQAYQDKIPTSDNNGATQVRNDYDAQILNITRKKQRDLHEDSGMTEGLKGLRIRLERVQALLKEAQ